VFIEFFLRSFYQCLANNLICAFLLPPHTHTTTVFIYKFHHKFDLKKKKKKSNFEARAQDLKLFFCPSPKLRDLETKILKQKKKKKKNWKKSLKVKKRSNGQIIYTLLLYADPLSLSLNVIFVCVGGRPRSVLTRCPSDPRTNIFFNLRFKISRQFIFLSISFKFSFDSGF
jgi:hypothetical protein